MRQTFNFDKIKEIAKVLSFSSFFLGLTYLVRFLLTFALTRLLSPEEFGYYSWIMSTFMFLSTLNLQGLDNYSLRKIAEFKNQPENLSNQFQLFCRETILKNSVWNLIFLTFVLYLGLKTNFFGEMSLNFILLAILGLALPFSSLTMVNSANLRVNEYTRVAQLGDSFIQSFSFVCMVWIIYFVFQFNLTIYTVIFLSISSWVISFLFTNFFYHKYSLNGVRTSSKIDNPLEWKKESLQIMSGVFGWVLLSRSDVFILGFFVDSSELSSYFISLRIAELMLFIPTVATYIWSGRVSNLYYQNNISETQKILRLASRLCFTSSCAIFSVGYLFSFEILNFFGESYAKDISILRWSLFSYLIISSVGIVGPMLLIAGQHKFFALLQWTLGIMFMICMSLIAPIYGTKGGVILFCIFQLLVTIIMVLRLKKVSRLLTSPF